MPFPRAIGPTSWPAARTPSYHVLRHSTRSTHLHFTRRRPLQAVPSCAFHSTPPAFFDDDDDPENWMRQLQVEDQSEENRKRKAIEELAARRKEEARRERQARDQEQKWIQRRKALEMCVNEAPKYIDWAWAELERYRKQTRAARLELLEKRLAPLSASCSELIEDIAAARRDAQTIKSDRAARFQARRNEVAEITRDITRQCDWFETARRQLQYALEDLKEEIRDYQAEERWAAHERIATCNEIVEWKNFAKTVKTEVFSAQGFISAYLKVLSSGNELLKFDIQTESSRGSPDNVRPLMILYQTRCREHQWWCTQQEKLYKHAVEMSKLLHDLGKTLEITRGGYSDGREAGLRVQIRDRFDDFAELSMDVRELLKEFQKILHGRIKRAAFHRTQDPATKAREVGREAMHLASRIIRLNLYIRLDVTRLIKSYPLIHRIEKGDLKYLRHFRVMHFIETVSQKISASFDLFNDYEQFLRNNGYDFDSEDLAPIRRRIMDAIQPVTAGWSRMRFEEMYLLDKTVSHETVELAESDALESQRKYLTDYAKEVLSQQYEDVSYFDLYDPETLPPHVLKDFMQTWPGKYLDVGLAAARRRRRALWDQISEETSSPSREYLFGRLREYGRVISWAAALKSKRIASQGKWLTLASIERRPRYHLDETLIRQSEQKGRKAWFSFRLYRTDPKAGLPISPRSSCHLGPAGNSEIVRRFRGKYIGFDMAWNDKAGTRQGLKANASVLVFARDSDVDAFHLAMYPERNGEVAVPEEIVQVLESPEVVKVGFGVKEQCDRLSRFLRINPRGFVELEDMHYDLQQIRSGPTPRVPLSIQDLALEHLGLPLGRYALDRSIDFRDPLPESHSLTIGEKAYAYLALWHAMDQKRSTLMKARDETPSDVFSPWSILPDPENARVPPQNSSEGDDADGFYRPYVIAREMAESTVPITDHEREVLLSRFRPASLAPPEEQRGSQGGLRPAVMRVETSRERRPARDHLRREGSSDVQSDRLNPKPHSRRREEGKAGRQTGRRKPHGPRQQESSGRHNDGLQTPGAHRREGSSDAQNDRPKPQDQRRQEGDPCGQTGRRPRGFRQQEESSGGQRDERQTLGPRERAGVRRRRGESGSGVPIRHISRENRVSADRETIRRVSR